MPSTDIGKNGFLRDATVGAGTLKKSRESPVRRRRKTGVTVEIAQR
jgi:hypothetical protein